MLCQPTCKLALKAHRREGKQHERPAEAQVKKQKIEQTIRQLKNVPSPQHRSTGDE